MGEVYRARDTRLDRIVAIKVLPAALAGDRQFRERFDREARAISALDHPHICALYDVGEAPSLDPRTPDPGSRVASPESIRFLVMQYLEGETLEQRLKTGALPLDQALEFAVQIADALDRAHRAGIVHRDLKPGNIMLTRTGAARSGSLQMKLLDFGLAKATRPAVAAAGASILPTTSPGLTAQGTIVGTFQYMTPEQLEGREADARSDIFAFGAVLYEMLTGKKAFEGKNHASLNRRHPPRRSAGRDRGAAARAACSRSDRQEMSAQGCGSTLADRARPAGRAAVDRGRRKRGRAHSHAHGQPLARARSVDRDVGCSSGCADILRLSTGADPAGCGGSVSCAPSRRLGVQWSHPRDRGSTSVRAVARQPHLGVRGQHSGCQTNAMDTSTE
jgi:serine/threonine protein kinase